MGEHVLIRGHIFTYAEKAPFVSSGCSLLGALEYDQAQDLVKCHECGAWFHGLGTHIKHHKITKAMYAAKHGLRINGALSSIGTRLKQSLNAVAMFKRGISNVGQKGVAIGGLPKGQRALPTFELHNERGRCAAQLIFKLQTLAAKLRHTPTQANLHANGLSRTVIVQRFGSMRAALALAGLNANKNGENLPMPLPVTFPTKEEIRRRFNERMAWPSDYFDAGVRALERRSGD